MQELGEASLAVPVSERLSQNHREESRAWGSFQKWGEVDL